jgi:carbamoyl-phosphate synthase large subunit
VTRSVLIIGSGPIVIGQAAEFDYSGTQACLACREAGVRTILVNSNPATIQTDPHVADAIYIEPLTVPSLEAIIAHERPDGLIATMGGQTALNLAVALDDAGVLDRYDIEVLGTGLRAIRRGEDRALFATMLREAGQPLLPSIAVTSVEDAIVAAEEIGYPVMCRSAFALGGAGSGFAENRDALIAQVQRGLTFSGSGQVLIEKSVYGWSEIEYEVVRDAADNCLVVCNMENIDPMGVHTGDSIVVAPSQTLSDDAYHLLRAASIAIVRALGVEGGCNVQYAFDGETGEYFVIEVNPRLSRSSALASKATGYPIAKVAARIALGSTLPEIRNDITGTSAFFEPALDYVVVKIPRWPFDKFASVEPRISTAMRSTGEVMAIGRTVEEALAKALRSIDTRATLPPSEEEYERLLREPNSGRLAVILAALRAGWDPARIAELSRIHPWFIDRIATVACGEEPQGRRVYKMVDTCAAEFEARTPYFYSTTTPNGVNEAEPLAGPKAIIIGSGPIRIGQGIEFDYATVHACHALSDAGVKSIIVNNNPETVSTDYSTSDRLYFEPLDVESVMAVIENEREGLLGVIPQFGGQTAINLVDPLVERGVRILGTPAAAIDDAEDREKTSAVFTREGIPIPTWLSVDRWEDLPGAVDRVGFPALVRPSYVLSGAGMTIIRSDADVRRYLERHAVAPLDKPLLVDHFLEGATELNVDAVADGETVVQVILEQLEECGVHSGDSADIYPPQSVSEEVLETVRLHTERIARAFGITGLMNVQYALHEGTVYVLEVNPRASRSVPFASKASGIPLADLAVRAILGARLADLDVPAPRTDRVAMKEVVLPFRVFPTLHPLLGPEMQSTGESMGSGRTFAPAFWKAWLGAGLRALPFGKPIYLDIPDHTKMRHDLQSFVGMLESHDCRVISAPRRLVGVRERVEPRDVQVREMGLVIVLGRSDDAIALIRRCIDAGVPYISTPGGLRGLEMALEEGVPDLSLVIEERAGSAPSPVLEAIQLK